MVRLKTFFRDFIYIFLNYFIAYIPVWHIRKPLYRLFGMKIKKGSRINMRCIIMSPWNIEIGQNTMVNEYSILDGRGGLTIADSCSVSMRSIIYTGSHKTFTSSFEYFSKPVYIGNCCWLGAQSVILPGSYLEDRTIISANSVYKGHSEINGIYGGNPAQYLRKRTVEHNYSQENIAFFR